ncbi:MAG: hypothetical protein HF962_04235, partial [Sulfurovum sp.]|nr:hypothetical protein [Sulfurovum sp.]
MKHIKQWIKVFTLLLLSTLFGTTALQAVDIPLDNTIAKINGDGNLATCSTGDTYRLGTTATYNGQALDILLTITATDNEYPLINQGAGDCIGVDSGILETRLRDRSGVAGSGSDADTIAFMDLQVSIVQQGMTTPLEVDRIVFSGFDLDTNGVADTAAVNYTGTDDIYMIAPSRGYIQAGVSNVAYSEGNFGAGYNVKLRGQNTGNCNDSATNPDAACRGGGIVVEGTNGPNKVTLANIRVINDNAYGNYTTDAAAHRLIQLSFKEVDFENILQSSIDHGDIPASYGDAFHAVSVYTVLGYGYPADNENAQNSLNADADDNPDVGNINFDDEDGVLIGSQPTVGSELNMTVGFSYDLNVTSIGNGFLSVWIDLNGDGDFDDAGEQILTDHVLSSVVAINTIVPVTIPVDNYVGQSYARFRFSENAGVASSGNGGNGEVEDYTVFFNPAGNITGHIYNDLNGNGTQDAGEPDLANVDVVITAANNEVQTITTDVNGDYIATGVAVGDSSVDIDETTLPVGASQTEGTDPTTVSVNANTDNFEENNGFNIPGGTLTGHLYNDLNNNGTQDGADTNMANVDVNVTDSGGNTQIVSTDANGDYVAYGLLGGDVTVTIDVLDPDFPIGATQTEGTNPTIVNIVFGATNTEENNGFYQVPPPAGQGEVCYGLSDGSDELVLYDADSATDTIIGSNNAPNNDIETMAFNVDRSVLYAFDKVDNGDVQLGTVSQTDGSFTFIAGGVDVDQDGQASGSDGNKRIRDIDAMGFDPVTGNLYAAVIDERVGNGNELLIQVNPTTGKLVYDAFGAGVDYVEIDTNGAGVPNDIDDLAIDADGTMYASANNSGGNDRLVIINKTTGAVTDLGNFHDSSNNAVEDLEGMTFTHDGRLFVSSGTTNIMWEVDKANGLSTQFGTFTNGSDYEGIACTYKKGDISGHLYNDLNRNGTQDAGEPDLANVDIVITDTFGTPTTVQTDANGNYLAQGIYVGNALVNIDENDPDFPTGAFRTEGGDPTTVTVVADTNTFEENNGFNIPGTLTGHIYNDINGNGTQDAGELNLENVTVTVTDSNGVDHVALTGADGNYTVSNLGAGNASVNIDESTVLGGTAIQTEGSNPTNVTIVSGNNVEENNGFFVPATLNGHLYNDLNGNGTQDVGEPDLANVDVVVTDANGTTQTVTTDANGDYTATGLSAGDATADIDEATLPAGSVQTEGTDPTTVTIAPGA